MKKQEGLRFAFPGGVGKSLFSIISNGSSELFTSISLGITTLLFNRQLMQLGGSSGVAAYALIQYLLLLVLVVFQGTAMGAQPIMSQNWGAGQVIRVRETLVKLLTFNCITGALVFILAWLSMEKAIGIFIPRDTTTLGLTVQAGYIVLWSVLFMPFGVIGSVFFTSIEKIGTSLLIAGFRGLILPVLGLLFFPGFWGMNGIWFVPLLTELLSAVGVIILLIRWVKKISISSTFEILEHEELPLPRTSKLGEVVP